VEKKLSDRLQDAYMTGNQELVDQLKQEVQDKAVLLQKKLTVTPIMVNTVLSDDKASALKIYEFLNSAFGEDWWELEFETIERLLWVKYGTTLDDVNRDKIWAVKYLCNSQRSWLDWWMYNQVAVALAGAIADFEVLRTPTPGMIINAIDVMKYIRPEEQFSREVKKYISILLIKEGIYVPPPSLVELIGEEFEVLLKNSSKEEWKFVYDKYKKILELKEYIIEETSLDIQARRLLVAEEAAHEYGK
jgi:hypothetical protein